VLKPDDFNDWSLCACEEYDAEWMMPGDSEREAAFRKWVKGAPVDT
jgi:hypothetical protein